MPINERKCNFCNVLEDEFHFILECLVYREYKTQYIPSCYWKRTNMIKLKGLMESQSTVLLQKLSMYAHKSFKKREELIKYVE